MQRPGGDPLRCRRDEGGDRALHVAGAAAIQHAVLHHAAERVVPPRPGAGRHHVGVAGETDMRPALADAREQILDRAEAQPVNCETELH